MKRPLCRPITFIILKPNVKSQIKHIIFLFQGMGGQFGYMGLWLDYEFGKGHSKAEPTCTTYGSPQLSEKPEFVMETVEVWAVGPKPTLPDQV